MLASLPIPDDLVDFLESGVTILVGTADPGRHPDATRAMGAVVSADRRFVTVFLPEGPSERALANLAKNPEIAVGFSRPLDHFSVQVKGTVTEVRPAVDAERSIAERYHAAYGEHLFLVGVPRSLSRRIIVWPSAAVTLEVSDLFTQTPGPDAGKRLERS